MRALENTIARLIARRSITDFKALVGALVMLADIRTLTDATNAILVALATALVSMRANIVALFSTALGMVIRVSTAFCTAMATNQLLGATGSTFATCVEMRHTTHRVTCMSTRQLFITDLSAHGLDTTLAHDRMSTGQFDWGLHMASHLVDLVQLAALDHDLMLAGKGVQHLLLTFDAVQKLQLMADACMHVAASQCDCGLGQTGRADTVSSALEALSGAGMRAVGGSEAVARLLTDDLAVVAGMALFLADMAVAHQCGAGLLTAAVLHL